VSPAVVVLPAKDAGLFAVARVLARLDAYGKLRFVDRADEGQIAGLPGELPSGVLSAYANGQWHVGTGAVAAAVQALPGGGGWSFLLGLAPLKAGVRLVLRRREVVARSFGWVVGAPFAELGFSADDEARPVREGDDVIVDEPPPPFVERWRHRASSLRELVAGVALLLVVLAVCRDNPALPLPKLRPPPSLAFLLAYPRIDEAWGLLRPFHEREDGALVIELRLADGRLVDPFRAEPPSRKRPLEGHFGDSALWTAYTRRIRRPEGAVYREELRRAIRTVARGSAKDTKVVSGDIVWVHRPSPEPGQPLQMTTTEEVLFGNR
jgi:hypothetical protein